MNVTPEPLEQDIPIEMLVAAESDPSLGVYEGSVLGYRCIECGQSDETLRQIVHREDCSMAGEHGRELYEDGLPIVEEPRGELRPDTEFQMLVWATTEEPGDKHNGEPMAFRCTDCGNQDECLFEIVHDEACEIAGLVTP